jgi:hypothetical protein
MRLAKAWVVGLGMAMLPMMAARMMRAQVIPLLPPIVTESEEAATPQQNRTTQLIQADLAAERFDELDRMADRFRERKTRMAGGGWRLRAFYSAIDVKEPTDEATEEHIAHLEHWIAQRPNSITARVAMAECLHRWAWLARGTGYAYTVTPAMAKLFFARIEREQAVLEEAAKLGTMCPQWYSEMMTVGLAERWDHEKMQNLFDRATEFEPGYLYFYREYANYLLPKWAGRPGDATTFAKAAADRVGGDEGDLIYFEVAKAVIRQDNPGITIAEMDWERIKRGAHVLDKMYGQSRTTMNEFAFMAYKYRDADVAAPLFAAIGERWATGVWTKRENYDHAREWAGHRDAASKTEQTPTRVESK